MDKEKYYDVTFLHPSRWIIYGPSCSGKTTFVSNLVENSKRFFDTDFTHKIYCSDTKPIGEFENFEVINDIEDLKDFFQKSNSLIVIDDNMEQVVNSPLMSKLFTKYSHHNKLTIIFITQNLFPKSKFSRNIYLNSSYIVLTKNPVELLQIQSLSNRLNRRGQKTKLIDAYLDATEEPYSYLIIDLNQETPKFLRLRTKIFNHNFSQIVYS